MVLLEHAARQRAVPAARLLLEDHDAHYVQHPEEGQEHTAELPQALARDDAHGLPLADGKRGHVLRVVEDGVHLWIGVLGQVADARHEREKRRAHVPRVCIAHHLPPAELKALYLVDDLSERERVHGLRKEMHQRRARQQLRDARGLCLCDALHAL